MRKVKLTRSARKRHIGKAHVVAAMNSAGDPQRFPAEGDLDERLLWIGEDDPGRDVGGHRRGATGLPPDHPRHALFVSEEVMGSKPKKGSKRTKYTLAPGPDVDLARSVVRDRKGRQITEKYVDRAVADVHAKMSRGRPSLTGRAARSPQVTFRLPPDLRAKAEARARREGKRVSEIAREALEYFLAS